MTNNLCVIFDLDGTLVDSEALGNQALLDLLPELDDTVTTLIQRYRGEKLARIMADLELRLQRKLPDNFVPRYRQHVAALFDHDLKCMPGVTEMLESFPYPRCVASSGPPEKIRQALQVTGLTSYFSEKIFSSYEIGSWKPEPGLFLHAANVMGFQPEYCVVIEDSRVGIEAGVAAGMHTLQYVPEENLPIARLGESFNDMASLPGLLKQLAINPAFRQLQQ